MDRDTRELLTGSVRKLLSGHAPDADLAGSLAELGWDEVATDDPSAATALLFAEHGRALARSRALDAVVLAELQAVLPAPAGCRAVAHPHPGDAAAGLTPPPVEGGRALVLGPLAKVDEVVAFVVSSGHPAAVVVPAARLETRAAEVFDRDLAWTEVRLPGPCPGAVEIGQWWPDVVAAARRALSAEILGIAQAMLEIAVEHTSSRVQFGRSIASFQAVRHRLAEAHADLTAAIGLSDLAAKLPGAWSAALAKIEAGRVQRRVAAHALQVCGAMGLSADFTLHRYVARAAVLDALYQSHHQLEAAVGRALLDSSAVGTPLPRLAEL